MPRVIDPTKESFSWGPIIRTCEGSVLYASTHHNDLSLRDYMRPQARRERGQPESQMELVEQPPDMFMGEQWLDGGIQCSTQNARGDSDDESHHKEKSFYPSIEIDVTTD